MYKKKILCGVGGEKLSKEYEQRKLNTIHLCLTCQMLNLLWVFFSSFPDSRAKLRPVWQEPLRDTQQSLLSAVSLEEATGSKVKTVGSLGNSLNKADF